MAESNEAYDQIAREAIEHALGRTFENPEAVPRRDAFIRDATDLLARFVAARCGNPGFHSARFFDAVIALSNARTRIRDAARRSRVVERLVEAERRVRALENALTTRNEQLVTAANARGKGSDDAAQAATLARAIADADARIRTLERELSDARNKAADSAPEESSAAGPPTVQLDKLDADEIFFKDEADATDAIKIEIPPAALPESRLVEPIARPGIERAAATSATGEMSQDPERRFVALKAEQKALLDELARMRADKEQVELERDALQAQIDQVVQREGPLREAKAALGRDRDALLARVAELERERDEGRREKTLAERDRDEIVRSRSALGELKRSVEQELALAQQEREQLRVAISDKETARQKAIVDSERAHEARRAAEQRIDRESTAAARARRERDDIRAERDRLKARDAELSLFEERWTTLVEALGADPAAPLDDVLRAVARRHELVVAHDPVEWDEVRGRLERLRDRGDGVETHAKAWLVRIEKERARYDSLLAVAQNGSNTASTLLEIAKIVTTHEGDRRALEVIEAALGA